MDKFGRKYILSVEGESGVIYQFQYPDTLQFVIQRGIIGSAQTGHFILRNLSQKTRNAIFKSRFQLTVKRQIMFEAGYEGESLSVAFNGNVSECTSYRDEGSVDFITEIEAFDLSFPIVNSFSAWSKATQPTRHEVISALVDDLVDYDAQKGRIGTFDGKHPRGFVAMGNTWELLQAETDYHCFFDNGKVHCLQDNESIDGDIPVLTSATGLLGSPKISDNYIVLQCLFEPRLSLAQKVFVQSRSIPSQWNQTYKVMRLRHEGVISGSVNGKCRTVVSVALFNNLSLLTDLTVPQGV